MTYLKVPAGKIVSFSKPLKKCEFCPGKVHKLISRSSFHLKGSGWYATDYAGKNPSSTAGTKGTASNAKKADTKKDVTAKKSDAAGSKSE